MQTSVRRYNTIVLGLLKKKKPNLDLFTSHGAYVKLCDVIHSFDWKSAREHDGGV